MKFSTTQWCLVALSLIVVGIGGFDLFTAGSTSSGFYTNGVIDGWIMSGYDTKFQSVQMFALGLCLLAAFACCVALAVVLFFSFLAMGVYAAFTVVALVVVMLPKQLRTEIEGCISGTAKGQG